MFQKDKQSQQNPSQPNEEEEDKEYLPSYNKLLGLAKRERGMLSFAVILMILSKATNVVNPIILASAYDSLVNPTLTSSEKMAEINVVMIAVVVVHFSGVLLEFIQGSIMAVASERVVARLRNNLYGAILQQEIAFFDEHQTGELVSRLGSDTTLVQQAASNALPQVFVGFVEIVAAIVVMFVISPELAGVTVGFVVVVCILSLPFGAALGRLSKAYQDALGEAQTHSTEALGGIRTVQAFAAEDREKQRYQHKIGDPDSSSWWWPKQHKVNKTTYSVGFFSSITGAALESIVYGIGFGSMFISLWYGFKLVNDGDLSLGKLTAFQTYIFEIGAELGQISAFIAQLIEARGASGRIFQLLEREPKIPSKREGPHDDDNGDKRAVGDIESGIDASGVATPPPTTMGGSIVFSNVEFAYPTRPDITVLRNFSLSIPPNSTAALVGSSGSGKSTVVGLLQRFYDVAKGSIHIDGQDIRDINLQWLRSNMGYVQQEPQLFGLTVRENICYGVDRTVSQAEIEHACQVNSQFCVCCIC